MGKRTVTVDIGVDAGMLMLVDPCYVLADGTPRPTYSSLLDQLTASGCYEGKADDVHPFAGGVVFGTRYGDGTYRARITLDEKSRRPVSLTIDLAGDGENEDEEDE